jgi:hypothetical protein
MARSEDSKRLVSPPLLTTVIEEQDDNVGVGMVAMK